MDPRPLLFAALCLAATLAISRAAEPSASVGREELQTEFTPAQGAALGAEFFGPGTKAETISLRRAVEMAIVNNLDAKFEYVGISIEEARRRAATGVFDPIWNTTASRESLRRPQNANDFNSVDAIRQQEQIAAINANTNAIRAAQGLPPLSTSDSTVGISEVIFDQQNDRFSSQIQGRTPWGMRYGFGVEANRLRNTYSSDLRTVFPEYQTSVTLTVIQPLLKNFGPAANLAEVRISRIAKSQQILTWKQRVSTSIQAVMAAYYDMLYGMRDIEVKQDAIAASEKLLGQNRRRLELGFMSPIDVSQAEVAVSTDREALLLAKGAFMERMFALKRLILDDYQVNDPRVFIPDTAPRLIPPKIDRPYFMKTAFEQRYDYQNALLEADAQDVRLRYARNQAYPQIDIFGTYGLNGLQGNYGDAFDQAASGHTPEWTAGVQVAIPLGFVKERAQLNLVKGLKEQAIVRIQQTALTVGVDVDTVISRILTNSQRVETAGKTRELSEETVRIALKRLEEGQTSSFDVIQEQQKLYFAKSRELGAIAELNKSITQLWLATGTMLERNGIVFDPPANERPKPKVAFAPKATPAPRPAAKSKAVKNTKPAP
jgi:outer membrane protein TolC